MTPSVKASAFTLGILAVATTFSIGYFVRGSDVHADAMLGQLMNMSQQLSTIAEKLPAQKTVEIEKRVEVPARYSLLVEKALNQRKTTYTKDALGFCKQLMYGRNNSNVSIPNLYDAITEWGTTSQANNGLEDRIMAHVMLVLIECFQNT